MLKFVGEGLGGFNINGSNPVLFGGLVGIFGSGLSFPFGGGSVGDGGFIPEGQQL
jgi:hypothetical protein